MQLVQLANRSAELQDDDLVHELNLNYSNITLRLRTYIRYSTLQHYSWCTAMRCGASIVSSRASSIFALLL
jgi:hypothetical protein